MSAASRLTRPCPICDAPKFSHVLTVPDHQSDEDFNVVSCDACGALYLNPVPPAAEIGRYCNAYSGDMGEELAIGGAQFHVTLNPRSMR